jgi:hypothetical protein
MRSFRVIYFSAVGIGATNNGGSLCCRSHVRALATDPAIELCTVIAGDGAFEEATRQFTSSLGARLHYLPLRPARSFTPLRHLRYFQRKYPFIFERKLHKYRYIDHQFTDILRLEKPDAVIVDYLPSALFIPSFFSAPVPRCVITLNREAEFHREQHLMKGASPNSPMLRIAYRRWTRIEKSIHQRSHGLIALTGNDLPSEPPKPPVTAAIPPFLEPADRRWTYERNRRVSFIGHIAHFPNRLAIEWICTRLAPIAARLDPAIRFRIIGASAEDVPQAWRLRTIEFLGTSDRAQAEEEFTRNDLLIAPIANDYGSKIKLLECVAFGTPFLGTRSALSGLSFLRNIPLIHLDDPEGSAHTLCRLVAAEEALPLLSRSIQAQVKQFQDAQTGIWGRTIADVVRAASGQPKTGTATPLRQAFG